MAIHSSTEERFWKAVKQSPSGCWLWQRQTAHAYLLVRQPEGKYQAVSAWRWAYETYREKVPSGMVLQRTCTNPRCVAPQHRRVVSRRVLHHDITTKGYKGYESGYGNRFHHRVGLALFAD